MDQVRKDAVAISMQSGEYAGGDCCKFNGILESQLLVRLKYWADRATAEGYLTQQVGKYVKDPLIDVRFTSFRVTVLGEVKSPGAYTLDMQRTNLFQALAVAGDLPNTAKRSDIQLYRDYNGERAVIRFDLRKKDVLYNPEIFELRHNDVIYVKPFRRQLFREDFQFVTSIVTVLASFASIFYIIIRN